MKFTKGNIDVGHFWYTNFRVPDPPPPSSLLNTSLGLALDTTHPHHRIPVGPHALLLPSAPGQFLLLIGESGTGKTSLCLDAARGQRGMGTVAVYAALSRAPEDSDAVVAGLQSTGAMDWTTVVTAAPDAPVVERAAALFTAFAAAEAVRDSGGDALLLLDDMSCLTDLWQMIVQMDNKVGNALPMALPKGSF